ncbi:MAG: FAD-dependent monooxygenase [Gammaproteobacteria bacterium]|nr:FAD-dependent monooxygenase [Gammaproteobacteria bacterium]
MKKQLPSTLVVGAGPVGMAGALELDRQGIRVRIIDKNEQRSTLSKAVGINARTLELLQPSGVSQALIARGLRIYRVNMRYGDRILTTVDFSKMNHPFNFMLSLPQDETEAILEEALQARGISVEKGVEFAGYDTDGDSVSARIRRKDIASTFDVDYILGADGAHSSVRKSIGLDFPGRPYEDTWSLADVRMAWPFGHGEAHLIMRDDGKVLFVMSMPGNRYRLISNQGSVFDLLPGRSQIHDVIWNTEFKVSLRQVEAYCKGSVYLAGDAAHIHSPAGGRGMNLGIEDAVVFARRLAAGELEGYSDHRHAVGQQVVRESDKQFRMASVRNPLGKLFRNFMVSNVLGSERVQRKFRRRMAGIDHVPA